MFGCFSPPDTTVIDLQDFEQFVEEPAFERFFVHARQTANHQEIRMQVQRL